MCLLISLTVLIVATACAAVITRPGHGRPLATPPANPAPADLPSLAAATPGGFQRPAVCMPAGPLSTTAQPDLAQALRIAPVNGTARAAQQDRGVENQCRDSGKCVGGQPGVIVPPGPANLQEADHGLARGSETGRGKADEQVPAVRGADDATLTSRGQARVLRMQTQGGTSKEGVVNHGLQLDNVQRMRETAAERDTRAAGDRPVAGVRVMLATVTAYCGAYGCQTCCGKWSLVADKARRFADGSPFSRDARVAAVDTRLIPFGSRLYIPGYGLAVARDRGGAIKGNHIDVLFPTHQEALAWGVKVLNVEVSR